MFSKSSAVIRESVYGVMGLSQVTPSQVSATNATAFMITPDVLVTAAHFVHVGNDPSQPIHAHFEAIRAPDVGNQMKSASFIAEDSIRDVALLRISNAQSSACVKFHLSQVPIGTSCGSIGFPLARVEFTPSGRSFNLIERFQGANISAFYKPPHPSGRNLDMYETDAQMYPGSSGCPGFLQSDEVFGMHVGSVMEGVSASDQQNATGSGTRLAISIWVPSTDIVSFARKSGVTI